MKSIFYLEIYLFLSTLIVAIICCEDQNTCEKCLRHSDTLCAWCSENEFDGPRCVSRNNLKENWCPDHRINPNSAAVPFKNKDFNSTKGNVIQIKPQEINIDIRPGDKVKFEFYFKRAENYPVDVYFLFDDSLTMANLKNETEQQINDIYQNLQKNTKDVLIGIGSFVDKNALPYTDIVDSSKTYSFINRLKLSDDIDTFKKIISEIKFGYNFDAPEGTLDAISQAIKCNAQVGWRKDSTKILVVLTNGPYHVVGDGHWSGIFQPYDGECYLDGNKYSKELEMDYPSVNIINHLASEEQITLLFIADSSLQNEFETLEHVISGSKMSLFNSHSEDSNKIKIKKILQDLYEKILGQIRIVKYTASDLNNFNIAFSPCYNQFCTVKEKEIKMTGTLKLPRYLKDYETTSTVIDVKLEGIKEKLKLNINVIRDCNCQSEKNSTKCSTIGTLRCGICECNDDSLDEKCNKRITCTAPNSDKSCSGHGQCIGEHCICTEGYEGKFCECKKCPRDADQRFCECECGRCKCKPGRTGDLCNCPDKPDCYAAYDTRTCSNRGDCICDKCECYQLESWDARSVEPTYCNPICDTRADENCHSRQCLLLDSLVLDFLGDNLKSENMMSMKEDLDVFLNRNESWYTCPKIPVDVTCQTNYIYRYEKDVYGIKVIIQKKFNCAKTYYFIGGGVLASLIVIGLSSLIAWKLYAEKRDRLEYDRLLKEIGSTSACDNILYVRPTTTIINPTYNN